MKSPSMKKIATGPWLDRFTIGARRSWEIARTRLGHGNQGPGPKMKDPAVKDLKHTKKPGKTAGHWNTFFWELTRDDLY